ncbi:phosphatidylethanolamine-binding protein [Mycena olivaceomarginata]|nr:phosphatidylethanolamine-binding protein [Mycena olivaceomarginata]
MPLIEPFSSLTAALTTAHLIPDVLTASFAPTALLTILLPSGPVAIAAAPREQDIGEDGLVKSFGADGPKYTLAMFDPDAPSAAQPTSRQFRHWVAKPTPAAEPTPYRPPGPPKGSGLHRYTFTLYREPPSFTLSEDAPEHDATPAGRRHWDAVKFGERNGLELVGVGWYLVRSEE